MTEHSDEKTPVIFDASPYLRLFIDKDGRWFQNGAEIIHPHVYAYFNSVLERTDDGEYRVRIGREQCRVEVEDAPFVVTAVLSHNEDGVFIRLNDGTEEPFDPRHFWVGAANVPYCEVKQGRFFARFSRPAYYRIAEHIVNEGDRFYFTLGGERVLIRSVGAR
jgi:uncharacterized protein